VRKSRPLSTVRSAGDAANHSIHPGPGWRSGLGAWAKRKKGILGTDHLGALKTENRLLIKGKGRRGEVNGNQKQRKNRDNHLAGKGNVRGTTL